MACVLAPVAEAVVMTVVTKVVQAKEAKESEPAALQAADHNVGLAAENKIPFSRKLKWLTNMLWGGSALLAFEHLWHGELVPWFPFLTAASDPAEASLMLSEMATVGVSMSLLVTAVWGVMVLFTNALEKKAIKSQHASN